MKRWLIVVVAPAALLPAMALISFAVLAGGSGKQQGARVTLSEFPDFVSSSPTVEAGYQLAVENQQLFARMPCYCGCGAMPEDAHRNLLDCFINHDGSFDPHASGCDVCLNIASDVVQWRSQGKSAAETRSLVDAKYQSYGPSTSTGPVTG